MPEQWFAVRTKGGKEDLAGVSIAARDRRYSVCLPVTMIERSHAGKRERVSRALYRGWLFARFDRNDPALDYGEINYCRGVASRGLMVNADGVPIAIPDAVIDGIRNREKAMLAKVGEVKTGWRPGDRFKLQVGKYADFDVAYIGEEKGEVWVMVSLFGRDFPTPVPFEAVPSCENVIDRLSA